MLYFTRKKDQEVYIGDNITVLIRDIKDGCVKIGIDAPKYIQILRDDAIKTKSRQTLSLKKGMKNVNE